LALEEATPLTKASLIAIIMLLNVMLASFVNDYWFFVVMMGSTTCPYLAYVVPADIYVDILKKSN
jgi:hypothetical protein